MTPKEIISVLRYFDGGGRVQRKVIHGDGEWHDDDNPMWDFAHNNFRPKPREPRRRWINEDLDGKLLSLVWESKKRADKVDGISRSIEFIEVLEDTEDPTDKTDNNPFDPLGLHPRTTNGVPATLAMDVFVLEGGGVGERIVESISEGEVAFVNEAFQSTEMLIWFSTHELAVAELQKEKDIPK